MIKMKSSGFMFMFVFMLILAATFLYPFHFESESTNLNLGTDLVRSDVAAPAVIKTRKMLEGVVDLDGGMNLKDYDPLDPVPDLKRSVQHGVIEHDNPVMPYIPKPSPAPSCTPCPDHDG